MERFNTTTTQWDIVGIVLCSLFLLYQQRDWVAFEHIDKIGIIITVVFWMYEQRTASQLTMRSNAGEVRAQAANMLALLERWVLLSDWLFDAVQPLTVAASAELSDKRDILSARDFLWNETATKIAVIVKCIVEEKLDTGHKVCIYTWYSHCNVFLCVFTLPMIGEEDRK